MSSGSPLPSWDSEADTEDAAEWLRELAGPPWLLTKTEKWRECGNGARKKMKERMRAAIRKEGVGGENEEEEEEGLIKEPSW